MNSDPKEKKEIEKLVEAQERGEQVEEVPTEEQKAQEAELDTRITKDDGIGGSRGP